MPRTAPWWRARISRTRWSDALRLRVPPSAWLTSRSVERRRASLVWTSRLRSPDDITVVFGLTPDMFVPMAFDCNPRLLPLILLVCLTRSDVRRDCLNRPAAVHVRCENRPDFTPPAAALPGLHLALHPGMAAAGTDGVETRDRKTHNDSSGGLRVAAAILVAIVIASRPGRAEDGWNPPHVRPETAASQELVAIAITRSPTIRSMIERLEQSDVVVYIRHRQFHDSTLDGHVGVLS